MKKYKVNLHLTEACNFKCRYCFAHFEKHSSLNVEDWKQIILNCFQSGMVEAINFAGGEPLLFPGLMELVRYARQLGLRCSLISNASLMDDAWIRENAGYFETIGISVDSFTDGIMQQIQSFIDLNAVHNRTCGKLRFWLLRCRLRGCQRFGMKHRFPTTQNTFKSVQTGSLQACIRIRVSRLPIQNTEMVLTE